MKPFPFTYNSYFWVNKLLVQKILKGWGVPKKIITLHDIFLNVFLHACIVDTSQMKMTSNGECYLPKLPRCLLQHIAVFLEVETGRKLRNVREFFFALRDVSLFS